MACQCCPLLAPVASAALAVTLTACAAVEDEPPAFDDVVTQPDEVVAAPDPDKFGEPWVTIIDEPSGARFALPGGAEPLEDTAVVEDGSQVTVRNYSATVLGGVVEVAFNIIDTSGVPYDLEEGVASVASTLDGDVVSSDETRVDGNAAVDVEMSYGEGMFVLFQLITTEDHVMQTLASGPEAERAVVEESYQQLTDSLEVD